jgi:hypothetical protein
MLPTVGTTGIATYVPLPVNRLLTLPSKLIVAMLPKPETFAAATANAVLATLVRYL